MPTIALAMIVKNEEKLIERCLQSVFPLIDYACISDTGSDDNTINLIRSWLRRSGIDGIVIDDQWYDFAHNRNRAIRHMPRHIDYIFMIDADDQLEIAPGFDVAAWKAGMNKDVYDVPVRHHGILHSRPQIWRNKPNYRWKGVLHEYLDVSGNFTREGAASLTINASTEGSRNLDPQKFAKDAETLEKALKSEKDEYLRKRYTFYLAQSYRDSGEPELAMRNYQKRAQMGGWDQEVYVSLVEVIRAIINLGGEFEYDVAWKAYERAIALVPERNEARYAMSFLCWKMGKNAEGMRVARFGLNKPIPQGGLFLEPWIYDYALSDQFAMNAYWAGHDLDCLQTCLHLLANDRSPLHDRDFIRRQAGNASAAVVRLTSKFMSPSSLVFSD
jgi:glycosyltransferase involved in cell wall biosynthesis